MQTRIARSLVVTCAWLLLGAIPAGLRAQEAQNAHEFISALNAADAQAEAALLAALEKKIDVHLDNPTLNDAVKEIAQKINAPIRIDGIALERAAVDPGNAVERIDASQRSAKNVLRVLLPPLELSWTIQGGVVIVTTKEEADNTLTTRVYPVLDLIGAKGEYCPLYKTITANVACTTWDDVGGPGSITKLPAAGSLIISQTYAVHEQIAALLAALRSARDRQDIPAAGPATKTSDAAPANKEPDDCGERPRGPSQPVSVHGDAGLQQPPAHE